MSQSQTPKPRGRGRPRGRSSDSRERIVSAAVDEFAREGYDGATIRSIAANAGVDPALVHHYFGSKSGLFAAIIDSPVRPDLAVRKFLGEPREQLGENIVRYVLETWDQPEVQKRGVAMLRSAIGGRMPGPLLTGFLSKELVGRVARALPAKDAGRSGLHRSHGSAEPDLLRIPSWGRETGRGARYPGGWPGRADDADCGVTQWGTRKPRLASSRPDVACCINCDMTGARSR